LGSLQRSTGQTQLDLRGHTSRGKKGRRKGERGKGREGGEDGKDGCPYKFLNTSLIVVFIIGHVTIRFHIGHFLFASSDSFSVKCTV